jgi:UDP-3-O-[3-hydroxymyristoyl] glucosamine N-acyltransferase
MEVAPSASWSCSGRNVDILHQGRSDEQAAGVQPVVLVGASLVVGASVVVVGTSVVVGASVVVVGAVVVVVVVMVGTTAVPLK